MTPAEFRRRHAALVWSNRDASDEVYLRKALLSARVAVLMDAMAAFGLTALEREWSLLAEEGSLETRRAAPRTSLILRQFAAGVDTEQTEETLRLARLERMRARRRRDYARLLQATYVQICRLRDAQERGDQAALARLAAWVDWKVVADEFETVAGPTHSEVRSLAANQKITDLLAMPGSEDADLDFRPPRD